MALTAQASRRRQEARLFLLQNQHSSIENQDRSIGNQDCSIENRTGKVIDDLLSHLHARLETSPKRSSRF